MCMELYHSEEDAPDWYLGVYEEEQDYDDYIFEESKTNNDPVWVGG